MSRRAKEVLAELRDYKADLLSPRTMDLHRIVSEAIDVIEGLVTRWEPMATAPNDGTAFIAFEMAKWGPPESPAFPRVFMCHWWNGDAINRADWCDHGSHYAFPTHWMALPIPPAEDAVGQPDESRPDSQRATDSASVSVPPRSI